MLPRIAYFVNQYPKVSHSFLCREILAPERQGMEVERFALRGWDAEVVTRRTRPGVRMRYLPRLSGLSARGATADVFPVSYPAICRA